MATGSGASAMAAALRRNCQPTAKDSAAAGSTSSCGMAGTMPRMKRMLPTAIHTDGAANWLLIWPLRLNGEATRVTIDAAAIDSSSAGIWATSASPIASVT